ncbi:MAG: dihydroorotase [Nitrospirota bacterium]
MRLLIKNGQIIDPASGRNEKADILIEDGNISIIERDIKIERTGASQYSFRLIDASGKMVMPGLIDMHTHLREPGYEYKETIKTGTLAASAGGFTSVCCMPNTSPVNDNQSVTEFIIDKGINGGYVNIFPVGAITKGLKGCEMAEIGELKKAGCVAISDDGNPVMDSEVMRRAMEYAKIFDIPVISHCEDTALSMDGVMNEGIVSAELGLRGIPNAAEEIMIAREIALAELTLARVHIAHISTKGGVRMLRDAKEGGISITGETTPHYFTLTEDEVRGFNTNAKVNPPLRTEEDVIAIKEGLKDGTIDVIATDHAPHAIFEKEIEFDAAPFGLIGMETALGLSFRLIEEGWLSLSDIVSKLSLNPSNILNLNRGSLNSGAAADIVIVDPDNTWKVDPLRFKSKSKNTPFSGWELRGKAVMTIVKGKIVWEDN